MAAAQSGLANGRMGLEPGFQEQVDAALTRWTLQHAAG
jgi:hypothetical protein